MLKLYKSYNFRDKDPVIDIVRTVVDDSKLSYKRINVESGVATGTLRNWFYGATKRPQFATIAAVVRACGKDLHVAGQRVRAKPSHLRVVHAAAKTKKRKRA